MLGEMKGSQVNVKALPRIGRFGRVICYTAKIWA